MVVFSAFISKKTLDSPLPTFSGRSSVQGSLVKIPSPQPFARGAGAGLKIRGLIRYWQFTDAPPRPRSVGEGAGG